MQLEPTYDLFISHSSADKLVTVHGQHFYLIEYLKKCLEAHLHPTETLGGRPRRFRVCTYEQDFELSETVEAAIHQRIDASAALLAICSRSAAESSYVRDELDYFQAKHPDAPMIGARWHMSPGEAFPNNFGSGALGADLAPSIVNSLEDWAERIEMECHKIVAEAWQLPLEQVFDRFETARAQRRRRTRLGIGAAVLVVAIVGAFAVQKLLWNQRIAARDAAIIELRANGFEVIPRTENTAAALSFTTANSDGDVEAAKLKAAAGLEAARDMLALSSVTLSGEAIGNETIAMLPMLPKVTTLNIRRAPVTDEAATEIALIDGLQAITLDRTLVSETGVAAIRAAHPDATVVREGQAYIDLSGWSLGDGIDPELTGNERALTPDEWRLIFDFAQDNAGQYGFPTRKPGTVLIGSFNIRRLSRIEKRSGGAWLLLAKTLSQFDLIAIQEIDVTRDDGVRHLHDLLGPEYGLILSLPSSALVDKREALERAAFFYNRRTVSPVGLSGLLQVSNRAIGDTIAQNADDFIKGILEHQRQVEEFESRDPMATRQNRPPRFIVPKTLSFYRAPFLNGFALGIDTDRPRQVLAVNAHLRFAGSPREQAANKEFEILVQMIANGLTGRQRRSSSSDEEAVFPEAMLLGDLNVAPGNSPSRMDHFTKRVHDALETLSGDFGPPVEAEFPFAEAHPTAGEIFATNIRQSRVYDHIGVFRPTRAAEHSALRQSSSFDYGAFNYPAMMRKALGLDEAAMTSQQRREFLRRIEFDVSDHLPIWIHLPVGSTD